MDLGTLPIGEMGWAAFVEYAASADDRLERYYLELKSNLDLNSAHGRHKVAKFVLGAANRDARIAARSLGGHAVMILGVSRDGAVGIDGGFEAHELRREVAKFTGSSGPDWDFHRVAVGDGRDVIAVVVSPPTGRIWPCLADGEGLNSGDIYLRGDGETKKANGGEVEAMLARMASPPMQIDLDVEVVGSIVAGVVDQAPLLAGLEAAAQELIGGLDASSRPTGLTVGWGAQDRRSRESFRVEVDDWRADRTTDPFEGVLRIAAAALDGMAFRIANRSRVFLRDVRIDVEFDFGVPPPADPAATPGADSDGSVVPIVALDWDDPEELPTTDPLPGRPRRWGSDNARHLLMPLPLPSMPSAERLHARTLLIGSSPVHLRVPLESLRPEEVVVSDDDDVVTVALIDADRVDPGTDVVATLSAGWPTMVEGRWTATADGIDDIVRGRLRVPVEYRDWRGPVTQALANFS